MAAICLGLNVLKMAGNMPPAHPHNNPCRCGPPQVSLTHWIPGIYCLVKVWISISVTLWGNPVIGLHLTQSWLMLSVWKSQDTFIVRDALLNPIISWPLIGQIVSGQTAHLIAVKDGRSMHYSSRCNLLSVMLCKIYIQTLSNHSWTPGTCWENRVPVPEWSC